MKARLNGLDALRGIAALIVLVFHANGGFASAAMFEHGWLAVDFFFALSGYIMARTYEDRMAHNLREFMALRLRRFWPLVLLGGCLGFPALYAQLGDWAVPVALLNIAFVPVFYKSDLFPLNGPYWSLFYELFANLAHALIFRRFSNRGLAITVAGLAATMAALGHQQGTLSLGTRPDTFVWGFVRVLLPYLIGLLLYRRWRDVPPLRLPAVLTLLLLPVSIVATGAVPGWEAQLAFVLVAIPLLLAGGIGLPAGELGRWLGLISFPLYVTHLPVLMLARAAGASEVLAVAIALGMAGGIAWYMATPSRARLFPRPA